MYKIVCLLIIFAACKRPDTMFRQLSASSTGIGFNNVIIENDSVNPLSLEFLYNGGGVAVGDFNNDSLPDLYFTASTESNKLYLNKGNLEFEAFSLRPRRDKRQISCVSGGERVSSSPSGPLLGAADCW